jgi:hypothetical protein
MPPSRIALEIGTHSPWISRLLSELGHEVIAANVIRVNCEGAESSVVIALNSEPAETDPLPKNPTRASLSRYS